MRTGTLAPREGAPPGRIRHVRAMIGAIDVFPVPARGEDDGGADPARTRLVGELGGVLGVAGGAGAAGEAVGFGEAPVADAGVFGAFGAERGVAGEHAEALW